MKQNLVGGGRDPRVWVGKEEFVRLGIVGGGGGGGPGGEPQVKLSSRHRCATFPRPHVVQVLA